MIFEVSPSQVQELDSTALVELMRKLLHAEAQKSGISLRGVTVPLQIAIPDGGEDARISWTGGVDKTDYLPCRFSIFQSKATDPGPAGWKKEVWRRSGRKNGPERRLSDAVEKAIAEGGSYVGFTTAALVGKKYDHRVQAIKDGISEAGGDAADLAAIDIYDCNKIAEWCSRHPSVAVWLSEKKSGLALAGFQTLEGWGKISEFSTIAHVADSSARYSLGGDTVIAKDERKNPDKNALTLQQARERISNHFADHGHCVWLMGPSGIGKSRFAYEALRDLSTLTKAINAASAIYCDFRVVGLQLLQLATALAQAQSPTLIVVDECPRDIANQLGEIANNAGSQLRIFAIDIDDRPLQSALWLNISVDPSDEALIEGIVRQRLHNVERPTLSYIQKLSGGYPRIAVLATQNVASQAPVLKSINDVVDRILRGCGIREGEQRRAIQCLALFEQLGADDQFADSFDFVADRLVGLTGDRMYEYIAEAALHHIVDRRGRYFAVQPLPIAAFLGMQRLEALRASTLMRFIEDAPASLLEVFFRHWRYFDSSKTAITVAERLLGRGGLFGNFEALNSELGSQCLDALTHVVPDTAADTVKRVFGSLTVDELNAVVAGRRQLVWALQKLAFRASSFPISARLLMRLGAAENEKWANNATGQFVQLYQLQLSGTEAGPTDRFAILDEGLASGDDRIVALCIKALDQILDRQHFSRSGDADEIGSGPPLKDWQPTTWEDVFDFQRQGLQRLERLRSRRGEAADQCETIIARHLRGLLCENLFEEIKAIVSKISSEKDLWLEAIRSVGDWLYFDRRGAPEEFARNVRALYDGLMPADLLQRAFLYTKFWSAEIRDPNILYDASTRAPRDYEYSAKKAREVAAEIALDRSATETAIISMMGHELHNAFPFAQELGLKAIDPIGAFDTAVQAYQASGLRKSIQFICGLLSGIEQRDTAAANQCLQMALEAQFLRDQAVSLYSAISITPERVQEIVRRLKDGTITPASCAFLSYGKGLDHLKAADVHLLLDELAANHQADGVWTALEIVSMYQHGRATLDPQIETFIKAQLTSPILLSKISIRNRDGHQFETLVELVHRKGTLDASFAAQLGDQVARVCQAEDFEVFTTLDDPVRKTIELLAKEQPVAIWEALARFFEFATPIERHSLESLVGPSQHSDHCNGGGPLFALPEELVVQWARIDPENRAAFPCVFYPILDRDDLEAKTWHGALERLAAQFGEVEQFRRGLAGRLRPSSWWGSMVPFLEIYLEPLRQWFNHPVPQLAIWAREKHRALEKEIAAEGKRDEEEH